jgi:hypothetical protein
MRRLHDSARRPVQGPVKWTQRERICHDGGVKRSSTMDFQNSFWHQRPFCAEHSLVTNFPLGRAISISLATLNSLHDVCFLMWAKQCVRRGETLTRSLAKKRSPSLFFCFRIALETAKVEKLNAVTMILSGNSTGWCRKNTNCSLRMRVPKTPTTTTGCVFLWVRPLEGHFID